MGQADKRIARLFAIVRVLHTRTRGMRALAIAEVVGGTKSSIHRDLGILRRLGLPLRQERRGQEVWYALADLPAFELSMKPLEVAALMLARSVLEPLEGAGVVAELDRVLPDLAQSDERVVRAGRRLPTNPEVVRVLDAALLERRRVRIEARVVSRRGAPAVYELDPICIRFVGDALYLFAWCEAKNADRTFKVTRITRAELLDSKSRPPRHLTSERAFRDAVKAWSGQESQVRIRLSPEVAWLAHEYPLVENQRLVPEEDGSVVVEATVAGLVEVSRWVLSWGRKATVLEPEELRRQLVDELRDALAGYEMAQHVGPTRGTETSTRAREVGEGRHAPLALPTPSTRAREVGEVRG